MWWLYGDEPFVSPVEPIQRESVATAPSGYVTLDGSDTWAFTRCCTYECRPAQADMLHVDIWWRGHNVVADAGTYSYNAAAPWRNGLAHTRVHNTIEVDGLDQMRRGPRFTWFDWTESQIIRHESGDSFKIFEGEHNGYSVRLGIVHRRTLILAGDTAWIVIDDILGSGMHDLASQWLIPAGSVISREPSHVVISTPAGTIAMDASAQDMAVELVEPADADALGWLSTRYRHRMPALSLVTRSRCDLPFRRIVVFGLTAELSVTFAGAHLAVWTDRGAAEIGLQPVSQSTLGSIVQSTRLLTPSSR